jgi:hypothetical protein
MMHSLLARQQSADELREGQEGRDGNERVRECYRSRRGKICDGTGEPLHAAIRQLDHEPCLRPCGVHPQQRKRPPIQRMRRISNGHLTSR